MQIVNTQQFDSPESNSVLGKRSVGGFFGFIPLTTSEIALHSTKQTALKIKTLLIIGEKKDV